MPRSATGIYTTPPGTDGVPGTTVESAKYNINVHDVEQDLNAPRPVIAGGTGATTVTEALVVLQAEKAYQVVTDYNSAVLLPGSFHSAASASNSPVSGHEFSGIAYTTDAAPFPASSPPANSNMTLEARDQTSTDVPGVKYVRQRKGGVWGTWVAITETGGGGGTSGSTGGTGGIPGGAERRQVVRPRVGQLAAGRASRRRHDDRRPGDLEDVAVVSPEQDRRHQLGFDLRADQRQSALDHGDEHVVAGKRRQLR